jgi:hypothetical protein
MDDSNNELRSVEKVVVMTIFKVIWDICLEELRKTTEVFSRDGRWPGRGSNKAPAEYKS